MSKGLYGLHGLSTKKSAIDKNKGKTACQFHVKLNSA